MSAERRATVVVASTRAATGVYDDRSGPLLVEWLEGRGFAVELEVVVDGAPVGSAIRAALDDGARVVVTSGGTGVSPTDTTPEQTAPLVDRELPGIAEAMRRAGADAVPTAVLSRGIAGVAGRALVVNLPGSTGGVRDGIRVLDPLVDHVLSQLDGGDHAAPGAPGAPTPGGAA